MATFEFDLNFLFFFSSETNAEIQMMFETFSIEEEEMYIPFTTQNCELLPDVSLIALK
jgi:hypothetical protein